MKQFILLQFFLILSCSDNFKVNLKSHPSDVTEQEATETIYEEQVVEEIVDRAISIDTPEEEISSVFSLMSVLGQDDVNVINDKQVLLNTPNRIFSDGIRLFVADTNNHRVLVWNTIPTALDEMPDFALGQPDLRSTSANNGGISGSSMNYPVGIYSDGIKLFVADFWNHRVLVWNTIPTSSGEEADFALGQPNLSSGTNNNGGLSASSLSYPMGVVSDGTRLIVADRDNHRVLVWNTIPTSSGEAADLALGQPDLVSGTINNGGLSGLSMAAPYSVHSDGIRLFVADKDNHRVLVWNTMPTASGEAADFALGQPDLSSNASDNGGLSASSLHAPSSIYSEGTKLFIADTHNHRILVWNTIPNTSGEAADLVLGQPDFSSETVNNGGALRSNMNLPMAVFSNGSKLFVADSFNHRVLVWNTMPNTSGEAADFALGEASESSINGPYSTHTDGARLFVVDTLNHRVLVWNTMPTTSGEAADFVLGQPDLNSSTMNNGGITGSSLNYPGGVFSDGTRLFVVDTSNHRVLVWNTMPTTSGEAADFALGQPDLNSTFANNGGVSGSSLYYPSGVFSDGTRLFVADNDNHRVLVWNTIPTTSGEAADFVLGQPDLNSNTINNGGISGSSLYYPRGVFSDSDGTRLFVADTLNHRVLVWNTMPTTSGEAADFVLGQPDLNSNTINNGGITGSSLYHPRGGVFSDSDGARLFIADTKNNRVLVWNTMPTTSGEAADFALGQPNLSSSKANNNGMFGSSMDKPTGVTSDETRLFVTDYANNRVIILTLGD